jgi:tRNA(fMet)-specific endonuclease VapC
MTIAELLFWTEQRNWGQRTRDRLRRFLAGFTVQFPDQALCGLWGTVMAAARRAGRPIGPAGAWIAATALRYGVPLVTHNPSDYAGVPSLTVLS